MHARNWSSKQAKPYDLCPVSRKHRMTRKQAMERAKQQTVPEQLYQAYRCKDCKDWHIGRHLTKKTLKKIHDTGMVPGKHYRPGAGEWHKI